MGKGYIVGGFLVSALLCCTMYTLYACYNPPPSNRNPVAIGGIGDPNNADAGGGSGDTGGEPVYLKTGHYTTSVQDMHTRGRVTDIVFKRHYLGGYREGIADFYDAGSYDPDGSIVAYQWIFPDEAYDITGADTDNATCRFTTGGDYTVTYKVKDNGGKWASTTIDCNVPTTECDSRIGYGWDHNYNLRVREANEPNVLLSHDGENRRLKYTLVGGSDPNKYAGPNAVYDYIIEEPNGSYTMYKKHGTRLYFDTDGCITRIKGRNGNAMTFRYDPCDTGEFKKLTTITDDIGRDVNLAYDANGLITTITDFAGRVWSYGYDPNTNDLLTVTTPNTPEHPNGLTTTYTYDEYHNLLTITDANGQTYLTNVYDDYKVTSQTYGDANFVFTYKPDSNGTTVTATYSRGGSGPSTVTSSSTYNSLGFEKIMEMYYSPPEPPIDCPSCCSGIDAVVVWDEYSDPVLLDEGNRRTGCYWNGGSGIYAIVFCNDCSDEWVEGAICVEWITLYGGGKILSDTCPCFGRCYNEYPPGWSYFYVASGSWCYPQPDPNEPNDASSYETYYDYVDVPDGAKPEDYGPHPQVEREVLPSGSCIAYTYDANGNVTGIYRKTSVDEPNDANDDDVLGIVLTYQDKFDLLKTIRDPNGNVYTLDYDPNGNLSKISYPNVVTFDGNEVMPVVRATYNSYGQVETITLADGIMLKGIYGNEEENDPNNYGRLTKIIIDANESDPYALEIPIGLKYDKYGNVEEVNDPNGDKWRLRFNALEQLTRITSPDANTLVNLSYNPCKLLSAIRRPIGDVNQVVEFEYDVLDHLAEVADPCSYVTSVNYNWRENLLDVNDAEENQTRLKYNERGLVCEVVDANGGVTIFKYTLNGKVREVNDPNGNMTLFKYDGFDRLSKIIYPDETYEQFGYDKNSNVTSRRVRDGSTIYYEYNALNQLTQKQILSEPAINFGYDIMGRVVEVNDLRDVNEGGGTTNFWYDRIGRVTLVKDIYGRYVGYQYYDTGLRKKLDYPETAYDLNYKYDALGRVTQLKHLFFPIAEYKYDQLSRRTLLTYGNDANIVYDYDIANQLRRISNNINDGNVIEFAYPQYDKVGNRLSMKIDDANTQVYGYDKLYQLVSVDYNDGNEAGYHYDLLGSRIDVNENGSVMYYWNNELNQYTQVGVENYSYDDNGNLIDDGVYKYYYDCEDRLTDVNNGSNDKVAGYKYDWAGRRVRKITYDNGEPNEITEYLYDGWHCIAEYNGETDIELRRFYYGPMIDEPIMMWDKTSGEKFYYHYDGLGSVVALSDSSGNFVERYSYDVFGQPTIRDTQDAVLSTSSVGNPYMFTGRRLDDETGLYYYRYRYYSPQTGRFLQTDPLGYYSGFNLYAYCLNNPVYWVDPLGLSYTWPWSWWDIILFPIHIPYEIGAIPTEKMLGMTAPVGGSVGGTVVQSVAPTPPLVGEAAGAAGAMLEAAKMANAVSKNNKRMNEIAKDMELDDWHDLPVAPGHKEEDPNQCKK